MESRKKTLECARGNVYKYIIPRARLRFKKCDRYSSFLSLFPCLSRGARASLLRGGGG